MSCKDWYETEIHFLEEPKKPHKETWYHPTGIRMFIDKHRSQDD